MTADKQAHALELARAWSAALAAVLPSAGGQSLNPALSPAKPADVAAIQDARICQYVFDDVSGTLLWIAASAAAVENVFAQTTASGSSNAGQTEKWQALLDQAVQSLDGELDRWVGNAPRAEAMSSIPDAPATVFAIEFATGADKTLQVLLGVTNTLIESWAAAQPANAKSLAVQQPPPTLDLLLDVELPLSLSFGRTYLPVRDILKLSTGSIVELNCPSNEYVDVIVNNCVIARGEVVVVEGNYGVRIDEIISRRERMGLQHRKDLNPARPMRITG